MPGDAAAAEPACPGAVPAAEGPLWRRSRVPPEAAGPGRRREGGAGPVGRERGDGEAAEAVEEPHDDLRGAPACERRGGGGAGRALAGAAAGGAPRAGRGRRRGRGWALCCPSPAGAARDGGRRESRVPGDLRCSGTRL